MELSPPLHPTGDHQIPNIEILKAFPLLLSAGLDVGQGGIRLEDVSPLVGILLMVEWERLVLVFQRTARKAGGMGKLNAPTRTRGWSTRSDLLAVRRRDSGGFAVDSTEVLVDHQMGVIEGHAGTGVVGSVGGSG